MIIEEKSKIKKLYNKGITLVALVVTIVILIILSTISISTLLGDNGLIKKAQEARDHQTNAIAMEESMLNALAAEYANVMGGAGGDTIPPAVTISSGEITENSIQITVEATDNVGLATENTYKYYLNNEEKQISAENTYTYTGLTPETEYTIKVEAYDLAGNKGENSVTIQTQGEPGIDAAEIASNATTYYGAEVKGYTCDNSEGVSTWRIYHSDGNNIYLIADDYINYQYAPDGQGGNSIYYYNDNTLTFDWVINDYSTGAAWINENSKAKNWLSKYLAINTTSTNNNMKAVAYMMDTNVWEVFVGEDAEYAIGGPTIELFCDSYKATHSRYIDCSATSAVGYKIKWSDSSSYTGVINGLTADEFNGIYIKFEYSNTMPDMWLASPADNNGTDSLIVTDKSRNSSK